MRKLVRDAGLEAKVDIDSAGTGGWHVGELSDPRTRAAAHKRGIALTHRARQLTAADLDRFDLVVVMDRANLEGVERLARDRPRGTAVSPSICLLRSFDREAPEGAEVPDPYAGDSDGFEEVLDQCERACQGLLDHVTSRL